MVRVMSDPSIIGKTLPVTVLAAYHPDWRAALLPVGLALIALLVLYRWVRAAWIGLAEGASPGYIVLYLCAAEAVPLLLLVHALRSALPTPLHP